MIFYMCRGNLGIECGRCPTTLIQDTEEDYMSINTNSLWGIKAAELPVLCTPDIKENIHKDGILVSNEF